MVMPNDFEEKIENIIANVSFNENGKANLIGGDFLSLLVQTSVVFGKNLSEEDKSIFASTYDLPQNTWGITHNKIFCIVLLNWLKKMSNQGVQVSGPFQNALPVFKTIELPPFEKSIPVQIHSLFERMFIK